MVDRISSHVSESLSEYLILPDWVVKPPEDISLETVLGTNTNPEAITLQYPYMTARMQCVVGPDMAMEAGRQGILSFDPRSLPEEYKQEILDKNNKARVKKGAIQFASDPAKAESNWPLEKVVKAVVEKTGHSVIPIVEDQKLVGVYVHDPDNLPFVPPDTPIQKLMLPLRKGVGKENEVRVLVDNEDPREIANVLGQEGNRGFIPIVDDNGILRKLAFKQKYDTNFIGAVVNTRGDWKDELKKWAPQVDTLCIDSSNACFQTAVDMVRYMKASKELRDKPFGVGNIVKGKDFTIFAKEGVDYVIAGMGVGSICQTGSKRGNGRGQFTVGLDIARARNRYHNNSGRYIPFALDGGIETVHDITVALALSDFAMMGNYFNRFFEAAGGKFKEVEGKKGPVFGEDITHVETWGEGSPRARLVSMYGINLRGGESGKIGPESVLGRYGQSSLSGATIEGVLGYVPYRGRLKPCVEDDARYIRATISNAGGVDLGSFRKNVKEKSLLEKASARTQRDMLPHGLEVKKE